DLGAALRVALLSLRANRMRGSLTTLGIVIGIVAVVTTMTAANGLHERFRESYSAVGADVVYVSRMPWIVMNHWFLYRNRPRLDLREARALEARMRGRAIVNPTLDGQQDLNYRDQTMDDVTVIGTSEKQAILSSAEPEAGRHLMAFDVHYKRDV